MAIKIILLFLLLPLRKPYRARWFNPASGKYQPVDKKSQQQKGIRLFSTPGDHGEGHNDWLLVLESIDK